MQADVTGVEHVAAIGNLERSRHTCSTEKSIPFGICTRLKIDRLRSP
jgi:hypothetical protein